MTVQFRPHALALVLVWASAGWAAGAELPRNWWPAFRGTGSSILPAKVSLPLEWSDEQAVGWRAEIDGYGQSSPVVWREQVFATSVSGAKKEHLHVAAFGLADGRKRWQFDATATQQVQDSDYVSRGAPTPAVDADHVYAFFESGDLLALDHAGREQWRRQLTKDFGPFQGQHGLGSSLAQTDEALFVLVAHEGPSYLLAIDKRTGRDLWKVERPAKTSWTTPIVAEGSVPSVIVSSNGSVAALDARSGKVVWSLDGLTGNTVASATVTDRLVIAASSDPGQTVAVQRDARGEVAPQQIAWRLSDVTASFSSPLAYQGRVYLVNKAGVAACINEATGEVLWTQRLPGSCWASPLGAEGRVYFFGKDGVTTVIAAAPEYRKLAENRLTIDGRVYGVAAVPGALVIRTGRQLLCVGKPAG